jgi:acyl carrier protein
MEIERRIRQYVTTELLYDRDASALGDDDSLLGPGLLDSVAILRLVAWLEEEFSIGIPDEDVVPDHVETVKRLADLVRSRQGAAG